MNFSGPKGFAKWALERGAIPMVPRPELTQTFKGIAVESIVYRCERWQIELIYVFPNAEVPPHRHSRVSSVELAIGGGACAAVGSHAVPPKQRGDARYNLITVPRGVVHSGRAGDAGCMWLSFQEWHEGEPGFITEDWQE